MPTGGRRAVKAIRIGGMMWCKLCGVNRRPSKIRLLDGAYLCRTCYKEVTNALHQTAHPTHPQTPPSGP